MTIALIIIALIALYGAFRLGIHWAAAALERGARWHLTYDEHVTMRALVYKALGEDKAQ